MNKTLLVLLAVCLVSAQAFVKRDAPAAATTDIQTHITDLQKAVADLANSIGDEAAKILSPDQIKEKFDEIVEFVNTAKQSLTPAKESKPAA